MQPLFACSCSERMLWQNCNFTSAIQSISTIKPYKHRMHVCCKCLLYLPGPALQQIPNVSVSHLHSKHFFREAAMHGYDTQCSCQFARLLPANLLQLPDAKGTSSL